MSSTTITSKQPIFLRGEALAKTFASISFPFSEIAQSRRSFLAAAWALQRHGIICLRGTGSNQDLTSIQDKIYTFPENIQSNKPLNLQEILYLDLPNHRAIKEYHNFRDADFDVINYRAKRPDRRTGSDAGMIGIFHPERLSYNLSERIKNCLHEQLIQRLLLASSLNRLHIKLRNLYLNQGVQGTRAFH